MFLIVTVFLLVMALSFLVVLLVTRPSTAERVIQGRIAKLSGDVIDGPARRMRCCRSSSIGA